MLRRSFAIPDPKNFLVLLGCYLLLGLSASSALAIDKQNTPQMQDQRVKQTFLSCAIITSEHLTALQLFQRGLPMQLAIDALPGISRDGRKRLEFVYDLAKRIGVLNTYADINTNFARCATMVYEINGKPAADLKEYAYYFCAGENKVRYEIILKLDRNFSTREITKDLPTRYHDTVSRYQNLIATQGTLAAFDLTANNLKACLQQIE